MTNNQTNITAEPGKQEIVITREFDASLQSGMESGVNDTYDRLAELLKKL